MPALLSVRRLALTALLLPLAPVTALAASATVSQNVNLRAGPGTSFDSIAELRPGDAVDVSKCQGLFCYITSSSGKGWVSAAYLTRDAVNPGAAAPARMAAVPPKRAFPPAYRGSEPAPGARSPADAAFIDLPPASIHGQADDFAAVGAPRPKADIPGGALLGPDDAFATDDALPPDDGYASPGNGWGDRGWNAPRSRHFGVDRGDLATLDGPDIGAARACLVDADGGPRICIREGERLHADADWLDRNFILRNPAGLQVTVCTDAPYRDCHVFVHNGPLYFDGGRSIASVSVGPTPGY